MALSKFLNREQLHKHQSRSSLQGPLLCKICSVQSSTSSCMNTLGSTRNVLQHGSGRQRRNPSAVLG